MRKVLEVTPFLDVTWHHVTMWARPGSNICNWLLPCACGVFVGCRDLSNSLIFTRQLARTLGHFRSVQCAFCWSPSAGQVQVFKPQCRRGRFSWTKVAEFIDVKSEIISLELKALLLVVFELEAFRKSDFGVIQMLFLTNSWGKCSSEIFVEVATGWCVDALIRLGQRLNSDDENIQ